MLKRVVLFILIVFFVSNLIADYRITRGPDVGEIYFIGPTATGEGIYYSTDFGETATCVDSISDVMSICADKTPSSLYRGRMPNCLYYSNNYGQYGSWIFRTAEGADQIQSGRNEGEIFKGPSMRSNNYGISFSDNSLNGCFCSIKTFEIDNQDSVGYILGDRYGTIDSLFLLISYDNFENLENQHIFNWNSAYDFKLTRGSEPGELYLLRSAFTGDGSRITELWHSNDFGESWTFKNHLLSNYIVGGRQLGELFVAAEYQQLAGEIGHIFIYHSTDFGETFTVYHTFSYGPPPYYANFEAEPTNGEVPLTVQFTDLSSGDDIQSWEWDFQNDGIIDSYEQNPEYTYQDTGFYNVKLRIIHYAVEDAFIKTNYIHVTENNAVNDEDNGECRIKLSNYPNPFTNKTYIHYHIPTVYKCNSYLIEIFNVKGQKIKELPAISYSPNIDLSVTWDTKDIQSGIYFYKINIENSPVKKMMKIR